MRFTLFGLAAVAVIGAIVVFAGPLFISTDDLRASLFSQVEAATGYRLRVSGPVKIAFLPSLDLVAEDVGIAQGGAAEQREMATAKSLRFGLELSALFGGKVKLSEVALVDPVIKLPDTQPGAGPGGKRAEKAPAPAISTLKALSLDKLRIKNGTLILPASGNAPGKRIEALTLEASLPASDSPLTFTFDAVIDGERLAASGSLGNFRSFLDGASAPLTLAIDAASRLGEKASLRGTASYKADTITLGQFTAKSGGNVLSGSASYKGTLLTLHPFNLSANGNRLSGSLVADFGGAVPAVNAALSAETLNLDTLSAKQGSAPTQAVAGGNGGGWSDAKIDFSPLKAVTAKLKLNAAQLIYNNVTINGAALQATVSGGKLKVELPNFRLYGGAGSAAIDVDTSGKVPAQKLRLSLAKFDAYPFLKNSAGFQNIEGTGNIALDLSASGASQRAMVSALSGTAKIEFTDGAIRGINIAKAVRNLSTGVLTGWQANEAEKTDFATLGASFKVANGIAQTSDLRLVGPLVRMSGAGTVDLPAQALKFRVDPQVVASLEGQGGKADLQGLGVPVMIAGPWSRPSIYPDIEGILKDPVAAYQQLNKLGGGLVSLPGAATGSLSDLGNAIKKGKVSPDALGQGAVEGLGQILGTKPQSPGQTSPAATTNEQPASGDVQPPKKTKKRQADARAEPTPEAAAKQALQTLFGN